MQEILVKSLFLQLYFLVCPAAEEPLPGWVDNLHGPVGILVGAGKGVIRTMLCHAECNAEVMPVDMAISGLLAIIKSLCVDDKKYKK